MKIAVIGTGIAGNGAAWLLHRGGHDIAVFETNDYIGGHSNTVSGDHPDVDTGFIVYNEWTYPNLIALFSELGVETMPTDMSFAASLNGGALEYSGDHLFGQKMNLFKPSFHRMWIDLIRFYKTAPKAVDEGDDITLDQYLQREDYSKSFIDYHILPMAAAIWSTGADDIGAFPIKSFVRFFVNHGLFHLNHAKRPQWHTIKGGSKCYVEKLVAPFQGKIRLNTPARSVKRYEHHVEVNGEIFDHVVIAAHSDQALEILEDANPSERRVLGAFPYTENTAYLHTDEVLMPKRRKIWSSWNYLTTTKEGRVTLSYWMNRLQPFIGTAQDYFVTLNPETPPDPAKTFKTITYHHPQYTLDALAGWDQIKTIQGVNRTWFCGAWCGYGFHEDGLSSGLAVAEKIDPSNTRPWSITESSPAGSHAIGGL